MAVVNALPNGYLVITLSPRESVALMDQILEPEGFPWQSSESQMIAMEVRAQLKRTLEIIQSGQTDMVSEMTRRTTRRQRRAEEEQAAEEERMRQQIAHAEEQARRKNELGELDE